MDARSESVICRPRVAFRQTIADLRRVASLTNLAANGKSVARPKLRNRHAQDRYYFRPTTQRHRLSAAIRCALCRARAAAFGQCRWAHRFWRQSHAPATWQLVEPAPL